jgi:hypothetical protein
MFKFSHFSIIGITICAFFLSFIPLIINSSLQLFFIEIVWALLYTVFVYFSFGINLYQMTYFYIICLYLKLKLRNANNSIRKSFETKFKMTYNKMNNILKTLNSTISEINTYNNDLWSMYLMIVLMLVITALDSILFQSIFGKMSLFFKIILIYGSSILFLLLIMFINTASSVSFEANKSYKLLNKLFITNRKQISIRMRVKVCIQTIKLVFKLIFLYSKNFLTVVVIY